MGLRLLPTGDGSLELLLAHSRAPFDPQALGPLVQLLLRLAAVARARAGTGARSRPGRRGALRLALLGTLLVDRPSGDLLGALRRAPLLLLAVLDVLVLTLALVAPCLRHGGTPLFVSGVRCSRAGRLVNPRAAGSGRCARSRTRRRAC